MYTEHFKLVDMPFSISPDPRYMHLTEQHREAIGKCLYVITQKGGLAVVYGDIGMGKTTIARKLYDSVRGMENYRVGMIIAASLKTESAFIRAIMEEFDVAPKRSYDLSLRAFQDFILKSRTSGQRLVVLIDEAQKLTPRTLDVVKELLNFESNTEKFLQIVLLGQNELASNIDKIPSVKSRVAMFGALSSLTKKDTVAIIDYRWRQAGGKEHPFSNEALDTIYDFSHGLPREINKLCNESLLRAFAATSHLVTAEMVKDAAKELRLTEGNA